MNMRSLLKRRLVILMTICAVLGWSFTAAENRDRDNFPESQYLVSPEWVAENMDTVTLVDVRTDDYFHGETIKTARRMPWKLFRYNDSASRIASTFIGADAAKKILGNHGLTRSDDIVLFDSAERDGGATASYVFWVLDFMGHEHIHILDGGIDAWKREGRKLDAPVSPEKAVYQLPLDAINRKSVVDGRYIQEHLGDDHIQIIDVRSEDEYLGKKGTKGMDGTPLKLGHIPTAVNIPYSSAWISEKDKLLMSFAELKILYEGIDPDKTVVVYCNSGRRSSYSYFVLRLLGVDDVRTYEASWKEWGNPQNFFPVETKVNKLSGKHRLGAVDHHSDGRGGVQQKMQTDDSTQPPSGYVSCGG